MGRYGTVIFDLDGTLLDTIDDLAAATNHALAAHGFPQRPVSEAKNFVGNGIGKLIERASPAGTDERTIKEVLGCFREYYFNNCDVLTRPYDGIIEMLGEMERQGIRTAIVSNKAHPAVLKLSEHYFGGSISVSFGEREGVPRKPAPDSVMDALSALGAELSDAVYVGDSEVDIATAANAGIPCISAAWGFKGRRFLEEHGAEHIIDSPAEIFEYI